MFNEYGVPHKNYYAIKAFQQLMATPIRLNVDGKLPIGVALITGTNEQMSRYSILASNTSIEPQSLSIRILKAHQRPLTAQVLRLDLSNDFVAAETEPGFPVNVTLPALSVASIRLFEAED
jgi:hypothetical protein